MLIRTYYNIIYRCIANATFRIINNSFQRFFIVRIKSKPEISYQVLNFFALIKGKTPIYFIRCTHFTQGFLHRSRLRVGTIKDGKIMPF